jgi:hypothetical protein
MPGPAGCPLLVGPGWHTGAMAPVSFAPGGVAIPTDPVDPTRSGPGPSRGLIAGLAGPPLT